MHMARKYEHNEMVQNEKNDFYMTGQVYGHTY